MFLQQQVEYLSFKWFGLELILGVEIGDSRYWELFNLLRFALSAFQERPQPLEWDAVFQCVASTCLRLQTSCRKIHMDSRIALPLQLRSCLCTVSFVSLLQMYQSALRIDRHQLSLALHSSFLQGQCTCCRSHQNCRLPLFRYLTDQESALHFKMKML